MLGSGHVIASLCSPPITGNRF